MAMGYVVGKQKRHSYLNILTRECYGDLQRQWVPVVAGSRDAEKLSYQIPEVASYLCFIMTTYCPMADGLAK